jgi:pimeloyl-ACP methyl ester carboxylesterase
MEAQQPAGTHLGHQRVVAEGARPQRWLWFLHGFLGRGENWRSFARRLTERCPQWGCVLVDLPLHGESRAWPGQPTVPAAAAALQELAWRLGAPEVLVGHSFGGRVALAAAAIEPPGLNRVWVLDAAPATAAPRNDGTTAAVMRALHASPGPFSDRRDFTQRLQDRGVDRPVAAWLAKNLERRDGQLVFGLALDGLQAMLADHDQRNYWGALEEPPAGIRFDFVLAGRQSVVTDSDRERLRRLAASGRVQLHALPEAGHWVHVDAPEALLELLTASLR